MSFEIKEYSTRYLKCVGKYVFSSNVYYILSITFYFLDLYGQKVLPRKCRNGVDTREAKQRVQEISRNKGAKQFAISASILYILISFKKKPTDRKTSWIENKKMEPLAHLIGLILSSSN